ncbi:unnamed protein product [Fusarium venenatum]|uniref:Uncharacterized protein n=1 Tax=Fusarium venenatum TaxID=56646 RepID=A0A2L2TMY6_9HYPO|nr:LOW QUALITY PROTEIN: uncharacterized protein FVRRES_01178 [Fusarium venenatum]CEI64666.1 unnamed protein product [Fusarium venenatum]
MEDQEEPVTSQDSVEVVLCEKASIDDVIIGMLQSFRSGTFARVPSAARRAWIVKKLDIILLVRRPSNSYSLDTGTAQTQVHVDTPSYNQPQWTDVRSEWARKPESSSSTTSKTNNYTSNLNGSTPLLKDPVEFAHPRFYNAPASNGDDEDATQVCWALDHTNETPQTRTSTSRLLLGCGGSGPRQNGRLNPRFVGSRTNPVDLHAGGSWETEILEARKS